MDSSSPFGDVIDMLNRDQILKELGARIRQTRKAADLTQEDLAEKAGLDRSYIGSIERGQRNITFTVLCQIVHALEIDIAQISANLPRPV